MKTFLLAFGLLCGSFSFAQTVSGRMAAAYKSFAADTQFKHALIGLYVIDCRTGEVIIDRNAQVGLAPASAMKVLTSIAAIEMLGIDYRYKTDFLYNGDFAENTGNWNLYVKASGDPTFGSLRWEGTKEAQVISNLQRAIKAKQVEVIPGKFVIDDLDWETQATPNGWTWEDIGNYFGAGARGFNWRENQFDLVLKPGASAGDSVAVVETIPALPGCTIRNELSTGKPGSGDNAIIYLPETGTVAYVRGTVPAGKQTFTISGAMPDPSKVFYKELQDLFKPGSFSSGYGEKVPPAAKLILSHYSPSLDSINYWFLQKSINLYGEALVKTIAKEKTGFGSTEKGLELVKEFWAKQGIGKSAIQMKDGSGLSPANRVTAHSLVKALEYARKQKWFPFFNNALPEQHGLKMKSGYIGGVRSYTGYKVSRTGRQYCIAFIVNNFDGSAAAVREKMWKLLDNLE